MMNSPDPSVAWYLLGFSHQPRGRSQVQVPPLLAQLRIECCQVGIAAAWYRQVDRSDFEGPAGERNLADLNWLTPRVLAHESVVAKLSELYPFYPARFGCLFSSLPVLQQYALVNQGQLQAFFSQSERRQEWGIKFVVDLDRAIEDWALKHAGMHEGKLTGAAYLRMKQSQRTLRGPVLAHLQHVVDQRIAILQQRYEHVAIRPTRSMAQPDRETLLANVALWLEMTDVPEMQELCGQWNAQEVGWLRAIITGPWPAYTFCPALNDTSVQSQAA